MSPMEPILSRCIQNGGSWQGASARWTRAEYFRPLVYYRRVARAIAERLDRPGGGLRRRAARTREMERQIVAACMGWTAPDRLSGSRSTARRARQLLVQNGVIQVRQWARTGADGQVRKCAMRYYPAGVLKRVVEAYREARWRYVTARRRWSGPYRQRMPARAGMAGKLVGELHEEWLRGNALAGALISPGRGG